MGFAPNESEVCSIVRPCCHVIVLLDYAWDGALSLHRFSKAALELEKVVGVLHIAQLKGQMGPHDFLRGNRPRPRPDALGRFQS